MAEDAPAGDVMKDAIMGMSTALRATLDSLRTDIACAAGRRCYRACARPLRGLSGAAQPVHEAAGRVASPSTHVFTLAGIRRAGDCREQTCASPAFRTAPAPLFSLAPPLAVEVHQQLQASIEQTQARVNLHESAIREVVRRLRETEEVRGSPPHVAAHLS